MSIYPFQSVAFEVGVCITSTDPSDACRAKEAVEKLTGEAVTAKH